MRGLWFLIRPGDLAAQRSAVTVVGACGGTKGQLGADWRLKGWAGVGSRGERTHSECKSIGPMRQF